MRITEIYLIAPDNLTLECILDYFESRVIFLQSCVSFGSKECGVHKLHCFDTCACYWIQAYFSIVFWASAMADFASDDIPACHDEDEPNHPDEPLILNRQFCRRGLFFPSSAGPVTNHLPPIPTKLKTNLIV